LEDIVCLLYGRRATFEKTMRIVLTAEYMEKIIRRLLLRKKMLRKPDSTGEMKTVSQEMKSVSPEMKPVSGETKTISQEMKSFSGEIKTISPEMKPVSREIKTISQEMKSVSPEIKPVSREIISISFMFFSLLHPKAGISNLQTF
jgi:uncharacterized coiled-coil DUF342 family protein